MFSNKNTYPASVIANEDSWIYFISKDGLSQLFSMNPIILNNFLSILSNRIIMLSQRIELLSHGSIREKISSFLLNEYSLNNNPILSFPYNRKTMAEILNIQRPSLSRELNRMKADRIINYKANKIEILNLQALENIIIKGG